MNLKIMPLKDVLRSMQSGRPFSIKVCSYDEKRGSGGKQLHFEGATLIDQSRIKTKERVNEIKKSGEYVAPVETAILKNPNHRANGTRNIMLRNGEVRKIHIRLIEEFNGYKVVL